MASFESVNCVVKCVQVGKKNRAPSAIVSAFMSLTNAIRQMVQYRNFIRLGHIPKTGKCEQEQGALLVGAQPKLILALPPWITRHH